MAFEKLPPLKTRALAHAGSDEVHEIATSREFFLIDAGAGAEGDGGGGVETMVTDGAGGDPVPSEELTRAYR